MTDNKISDADVKKALEICSDKLTISCPDDCPFYDECEKDLCALERQALDLINRKDAKIERLQTEIRNTDNALASLDRPLIEVKSEAYNEFADKLVGAFNKDIKLYGRVTVHDVALKIKDTLKELTEGGKEDGMD